MRRLNLGATLFVIPALILLVWLGIWQLQRREWKHDFMARIDAAAKSQPEDLVAVLSRPPDQWAYAHVEADGDLAPYPAAHLFAPLGDGAADYRVIAPLDYGDGRKILVDLGSITEIEKARLGDGVPPQATGTVHIEGILRPSEPPSWFTAAPDLKANRWYARDIPAMAAAMKLGDLPPVMIQSESPNAGGLPRAIPFHPDLPDNHLAYAVTWFSLAIVLIVVYVLFHVRRRDP